MLPRIKIYFENGNLNQVVPSPDGLVGYLCTGVAVGSSFELATAYKLTSMDSLNALGITQANNPSIFKIAHEHFAEAGVGAECYIMAFADTVKHSDMIDLTQPYAKLLCDGLNGKLRTVLVSRTPAAGYTPAIVNGLDADIELAKNNAQLFANYYRDAKYAPLTVIIEGYAYNGNAIDLTDLSTQAYSSVSVLIGDTVANSKNAAMGIIGGRLAISPVQRNIARVKTGPLTPVKVWVGNTIADLADIASIHDKGYITFRTFVNQSGYYFNDDFTATKISDDYCHLTARRTIDKAYRITYNTLIQELLDEVSVNADGTMQVGTVKAWESMVEAAIVRQMTTNGELSADVTTGETGVKCYIDEKQDVVNSSKIIVHIKVRPFGYPRYMDVYLGFGISTL